MSEKPAREIIDVVMGIDEREFLEFRTEYLSGLVAKTYVGEARFTHSLEPKPLFFRTLANVQNPNGWEPIEIPVTEESTARGSWVFEKYSRDWLVREIARRHPDSLILLCDMDEIPGRSQLARAAKELGNSRGIALPMKLAYLRANWCFQPRANYWTKAKLLSAPNADGSIRSQLTKWASGEPGVHLSYVGFTPDQLRKKLGATPHREYSGMVSAPDSFFDSCFQNQVDLFGRVFKWGNGILRAENREQLNEAQREAINFCPEWFEPGYVANKQERKEAAITVHFSVKQQLQSLPKTREVPNEARSRARVRALMRLSAVLNSWRFLKNVLRFG